MYNKVFRFLLTVKHSLWALLNIDAKELADQIKETLFDESNDDHDDEESLEEKEHKLHRIILCLSSS